MIYGFKALLFMAAGAVIHAFMDQQDMRRYGGLVNVLPFVYSALLLGSLSLMAMPYMTGWYSKDGILEMAVGNYRINGSVIYIIGTLVAGLTAFYSMRLVFMTFLVEPNANHTSYHHAHESNGYVIIPLVVLSVFAIVLGYLTSDLYRGMGSDFLAVVAATSPSIITSVDAEFGAITLWKLMPLAFTVLGSLVAYWLYMTPTGTASLNRIVYDQWAFRNVYGFLSRQWNYDSWVISVMIMGGLQLGHNISKVIDRGILEAIGPYGLQQGFTTTGTNLTAYSTGIITDFAMYIVLGMLVLVTLFTVPGIPLLASMNVSGVGVPLLAMLLMVNGVSAFMVMRTPSDTL